MKTNYTVKNFRVFDKNGATVEFAPLTFLVGCNSSGKSSIVKSLTLLKTFFKNKFDKDHPVIGSTIDFSAKPNNTLGAFNNAVHSSSRDKKVVISYVVYSSYIDEDVAVTLTMGNGELDKADITAIEISKKDGTVLVAANSESHHLNGNLASIKEAFKQYLIATRLRMKAEALSSDAAEDGAEVRFSDIKEIIDWFDPDAFRYCSLERIQQICQDGSIEDSYTDEYVKQAIDKYAETGIMTYYSIFDKMGEITTPEGVASFLKSKVKEGELHDAMMNVIDHISGWFKKSGCSDFLSFYRLLEDIQLMDANTFHLPEIADGLTPVFPFDDPIETIRRPSEYDSFVRNKPNFYMVKGLLHYLAEDEPYSEVRGFFNRRHHPLYEKTFCDFVKFFFLDVISKDITENLDYISSSRIQVRRMYPMEDHNDFIDAVRRYSVTKKRFISLKPYYTSFINYNDSGEVVGIGSPRFVPGCFMDKWLQIFKIGDHMSLEMDKNGLGLLLKVYRTASDKKGVLLADMGYGITQLFSILLQIEEMIMSAFYQRHVDYDKMQKETLIRKDIKDIPFKPRTLAIEEPEIHLHPKYQSLLAEMFYEAYKEYNIQFIIETHSEYLLRKVQTLVGTKNLIPEEVSMIYVEDEEEVKKGAQKVRRIPVKDDGRLADAFGPGFYDEADNLSLALFTNMGR